MLGKDFKKLANKIPDDAEVFLSSDAEGNDYHPVVSIDLDLYYINDDDYLDFYTKEDRPDDAKPAVVIWPG